jgi:hypothetical protein
MGWPAKTSVTYHEDHSTECGKANDLMAALHRADLTKYGQRPRDSVLDVRHCFVLMPLRFHIRTLALRLQDRLTEH